MRKTYYKKDSRHAVLDRVHRRRAQKAGVEWEKVNLLEIFNRDPNCPICKREMHMNTGQSDPRYVSLDHIVPLSKGGAHKADNIQLVCIECNRVKSNKEKKENDNGSNV